MKTSIAYQMSNIVLRNEIYYNGKGFMEALNKGPENMKVYLFNLWNEVKKKLSENKDIEISDINKNVTIEDFDITSNVTPNNIRIFYFIFPDSDEAMAQCKSVALAIANGLPRYFTMEYYSKDNSSESFMFGEWVLNMGTNSFIHNNYGLLTSPTIGNFAFRVQENLLKN